VKSWRPFPREAGRSPFPPPIPRLLFGSRRRQPFHLKNPSNQKIQAVPRHREIKKFTAKSICQKLEIPIPLGS
jgi:hypothetical protein